MLAGPKKKKKEKRMNQISKVNKQPQSNLLFSLSLAVFLGIENALIAEKEDLNAGDQQVKLPLTIPEMLSH